MYIGGASYDHPFGSLGDVFSTRSRNVTLDCNKVVVFLIHVYVYICIIIFYIAIEL